MGKTSALGFDFRAAAGALAAARDRVAELDSKLDALLDERGRVERAPVARGEATEAMERQVDTATRAGALALRDAAAAFARDRSLDLGALFVRQQLGDPSSARPRTDVLVTLLADQLKRAMRDAIETSPAFSDDALPRAARAEKLAELDREIEHVEAERAQLADQLRAAGLDVIDTLEEVEG